MEKFKFTRETLVLTFILLISAVLNLANLSVEGYANLYYSAGVKSMTMSLKNFFFVSFDPGSFVSIDKPPLGFWIQAVSAKIFGFSGWSVILPQAIAGVVSVWLLYRIVKRSFGSAAGLISALCLAVTPVFVATSRNNTVDNILILTLLFSCWTLSIAAERGKLKYLLLSLGLVGIGFNIKMLQAYMIVPALYITYLLAASASVKQRIKHLVLGTVVLLVVSFSWAVIVDLVPANSRPFVGSSTNNTVMELIIGHNGLERLGIGNSSTPGGGRQNGDGQGFGQPPRQGQMPDPNGMIPGPDGIRQGPRDGAMQNADGNKGGMGGSFGGQEKASVIRLFSNNSLSDQISWLLPISLIGFLAAAIKESFDFKLHNGRKASLMLWIMWLLPEFIYFSFTKGLFHPYYLTMMAPPIAALAGIGAVSMLELYKEGGWRSWLLPAAIIVNGLIEILLISYHYSTSSIAKVVIAVVVLLSAISAISLIFYNLSGKNLESKINYKVLIATTLAALLTAPTVWSATAIFYPASGTFPAAGLSIVSNRSEGGFPRGISSPDGEMNSGTNDTVDKVIEYLRANRTNEKYLVAVPSAMGYASNIIINYGEPVMTLGGFSGSDKILTLDEFKKEVSDGVVRFAIIDGAGGPGNNEISNWIRQNAAIVDTSQWADVGRNSIQIYDMKDIAK